MQHTVTKDFPMLLFNLEHFNMLKVVDEPKLVCHMRHALMAPEEPEESNLNI